MKWRQITRFKFNNKFFSMLLNEDGLRFFMEIKKNGELDYPDFKNYVVLSKKYNYHLSNSYMKTYEKNLSLKIKLRDKVIPLSLALSIMTSSAGCTLKNKEKGIDQAFSYVDCASNGLRLKKINGSNNMYLVDAIDCSKIDKGSFIYGLNNESFFTYTEMLSPNEISPYLNNVNVTTDELKKLINKSSFPDFIKETLCEGIDNLDRFGININKDILYYNLSKMKIVYYDEVSNYKPGIGEVAKFDSRSHIVYFDRNTSGKNKNVICHEILGHGSVSCFIDDKEIKCTIKPTVFIYDDAGNIVQANDLGYAFDEAYADIISSLSTLNKISSTDSAYSVSSYGFLLMLEIADMTLSEYASEGVLGLLKRTDNFSYDYMVKFISSFDTFLLMSFNNDEYSFDYSDNIISYIKYYIDNLYSNGYFDEEIKTKINHLLNSYMMYLEPLLMKNCNPVIYSQSNNGSTIMVIPQYINDEVNKYLKEKDKSRL